MSANLIPFVYDHSQRKADSILRLPFAKIGSKNLRSFQRFIDLKTSLPAGGKQQEEPLCSSTSREKENGTAATGRRPAAFQWNGHWAARPRTFAVEPILRSRGGAAGQNRYYYPPRRGQPRLQPYGGNKAPLSLSRGDSPPADRPPDRVMPKGSARTAARRLDPTSCLPSASEPIVAQCRDEAVHGA